MPAMEEHLFWIVSRAAGTAALLLSSAAVAVGAGGDPEEVLVHAGQDGPGAFALP